MAKYDARKKVLDAIIAYIEEHQYPPTIMDLCDITGKSPQTIRFHVNNMFESGELETDCGIGAKRAIRVPGYKFVKVEN